MISTSSASPPQAAGTSPLTPTPAAGVLPLPSAEMAAQAAIVNGPLVSYLFVFACKKQIYNIYYFYIVKDVQKTELQIYRKKLEEIISCY
jgi:hypothetical protein